MSVIIPVDNRSIASSQNRINRSVSQYAWPAAVALFTLLLAASFGGFASSNGELTLLSSPAVGQSRLHPAIKTGAIRTERKHGYVTVTGMAANVTGASLKNVEAFVELFDKRGELIRSESALIGIPVLQAGEESPYSIQTRDMPEATSYRVRFRELLGASIPSTLN